MFALICHHDDERGPGVEFTYWPTRSEAEAARDDLTPCSTKCAGIHSVVGVYPVPRETRNPVWDLPVQVG